MLMSMRGFVFLVLTSACAANAAHGNEFILDDHNRLHAFEKSRMRPLSDEIGKFIINPPMPQNSTNGLRSSNRTQDCMIQLTATFDMMVSDFKSVTLLVGLAAKMGDAGDEWLLLKFVKLYADGFLAQDANYRAMLNATARKCADDGATVAKSQEALRVYGEAETLIRAIAEKVKTAVP